MLMESITIPAAACIFMKYRESYDTQRGAADDRTVRRVSSPECFATQRYARRLCNITRFAWPRALRLLSWTSTVRQLARSCPQPAGLAAPAARNDAAAAAVAAAGLTAAPSGVPATFLRLLSGTSLPPGVGRDGLGGTGAPCNTTALHGPNSRR